jgi:MFS family permease
VTAAIRRANRRTFASLRRHRNYRLFFAGQIVSVSGTWMQNIAAAWLVLQLTHSPVAVGILALCQFLPFTIFGLFAGVLVDRLDARRTVMGTQSAALVLAAILAGLTLAGHVTAFDVELLTALRGVVLVLDAPARQALTFEMVGADELPNAVALNSSLFNAARVVGPAVGGALVAGVGVGACFALNALSYVAVLAGLALMRREELFPVEKADTPPRLLRGTAEALAHVRRSPATLLALAIVFVVSTLSFNFNVLLPVLADQTLNADAGVFGLVTAAFGAGALAGALLSASLGRASWKVLLGAVTGFGAAQLAVAPLRAAPAAAALLFVAGACFTLWTSAANSTVQLSTPGPLRGRVIGLYYFAFNGAGPAGGVLAGWLAARGGTELAFAVSGASALAMAAVAATVHRRREHPLSVGAVTRWRRAPGARRTGSAPRSPSRSRGTSTPA